jgi:hypothetical protein
MRNVTTKSRIRVTEQLKSNFLLVNWLACLPVCNDGEGL